MEIVTLSGIEEFVGKHNRGEPLPNNWESLVLNYIRRKERFMKMHKKRYDRAKQEFEQARDDYYLLSGVKFK